MRKPEADKNWTTIYYGARGSGKTLHQAIETLRVLEYLEKLYGKFPTLRRAIVFTNQKLSGVIEKRFASFLHYWEDADDFHFCPRVNCWRGNAQHRLHGCYLIFDDIATILPPDQWNTTPIWMRKTFLQARHFGIRILANLQDPFAVDINFRRCVDVAYKFTKIFGNPDPDETKLPVKRVFGLYRRRKVDAETLWRHGDLPEQTIRLMLNQRDEQNEQLKKMGKELDIVYDESWFGSYHLFNRSGKFLGFKIASTEIYDTLQDVQEYEPRGFAHKELKCIDPNHIHPWDEGNGDKNMSELKKLPNFCDHVKVYHEII